MKRLGNLRWLAPVLGLFLLSAVACGDDDNNNTSPAADNDVSDDDVSDNDVSDDDTSPTDDDDNDDNDDDTPEPSCPADDLETAKAFLSAGNADAARALFQAILEEYPACSDAYFGVALADQLRLVDILDELLYLLLDPIEKKTTIDVGAVIADYAENLLEPITVEILENLAACAGDEALHFLLDNLTLAVRGLDVLVYAGEYDHGDVLLQQGEFTMFAAALNTILAADLSFDFQIVLDHAANWEGMGTTDLILDILAMLLEIIDDPNFPEFLSLREGGLERMAEAGRQMGFAFQYLHDATAWLQAEPIDDIRDVTGCSDRNDNGRCEGDEFLHGLMYSLPADLHAGLREVDLALRDSYWDGTELDVDPEAANFFRLSEFNRVLRYFGLPPLLLPIPIDFGGLYTDPDPEALKDTLRLIIQAVQWLVEQISAPACAAGAAPAFHPGKAGVPQGPPEPGLAAVVDAAALPYLQPTARTMQFSSHDPTGGNDDGFSPPNHLFLDEHGEFVIFDQFGPGCIYRLELIHTWSVIANVRVYVDDLETPVLEGPLWLLFYSAFAPFTAPLVENMLTASGANFSYLPLCFAARARITFNVPPEFFNVTYVKYDADTTVQSYTGAEDDSSLRAAFRNVGVDPKPDVQSEVETGTVAVAPGETVEIMRHEGAGAVWRLYLSSEPFTQEVVQDLWLLAEWDGAATPAVAAPLPEFFGSFLIDETPRTLLFGHDGARYFSYFPMPFWQSGVLKVENRGAATVNVSFEVQLAAEAYGRDAGYFKAFYQDENPVAVGRDYHIAQRAGAAGKWLGLTHTLRGALGKWYLEGDERFYIDGSASPAVYGTGTEDYYNGGWYFQNGPYTRPLCGNAYNRDYPDYAEHGAYRLHLGDAVHYLSAVRLGIEHGADNSAPTDYYSSVSYFYERNTPLLVETDFLDVSDAASEAAHGYTAVHSTPTGELVSYYEGEDDEVSVADSGRATTGESVFLVALDSGNQGVVLRRRYDQTQGGQRATVLVDGVAVGVWYNPEHSAVLRWAEDDFVLPPSVTAGKTSIEITIRVEGDVPWSEFAYWIFSIAP